MPSDEEQVHRLSDVQTNGIITPEETHDVFKSEANRIQSFSQWPEEQTGQTGVGMARAGFYYTGDKTTVQCFECRCRLNQWSSEDIPLVKHRLQSPNCQFINNLSDNRSLVQSTGISVNVSDDSGHNSCGSSPLSSSPPNTMSNSTVNSSDENEDQFLNNNNNNNNNPNNDNNNREETVNQIRERMKSENNRLQTFYINSECIWPVPGVNPQELARAGFHYLNDDRVQCAFCTGVISNWAPGLRPLEEHANHFPLCPFIMEEDVGNIPISVDPLRDPLPVIGHDVCGFGPMGSERIAAQIQSPGGCGSSGRSNSANHLQKLGVELYTGPKTPDMGPLDIRKASFRNSNWDNTVPVSTDRLAEAGFYYFRAPDIVKCFHCDLGLSQWEEGDDPWIEHAKKADECNFLKLNKSKTFLEDCKRMEESENPNQEKNTGVNDVAISRTIDEWMTTELVQEFMSLNLFPSDLVKAALQQRYFSHSRLFDSFADMYDTVSALAERSPSSRPPVPSVPQNENPLLNVIEMKPTPSTTQQSNTEQSVPNEGTSGQSSSTGPTITSTESSNNHRRSPESNDDTRLLCKICYLAEIEVVFLACGHQMSCTQCAQRLTDCPVCRQPIQGYVRTFFS